MRTILTLTLVITVILTVASQEPGFQLRQVTVFKNGIAFLEKEAVVDASSGTVSLPGYPVQGGTGAGEVLSVMPGQAYGGGTLPVLFGTVSWSAPGNEVLEVVTGTRMEVSRVPADNLFGLLQLNPGKKVCIWTKDTKGPSNCGFILGYSAGDGTLSGQLLLRDGQTLHQFALRNIQRLEFEADAVYEAELSRPAPSLRLKLAHSAPQQPLQLSYLQKGMSWLPVYHMVLTGDGKARLSLFAQLINDIEPLDGVPARFAVGIPSFRFGYLGEPLFARQTVLAFLNNLDNVPAESLTAMANVITSQRVQANTDNWPATGPAGGTEGQMDEGLFFYERGGVYLEEGGRGLFKLLEQEVAYQDLYIVDIQAETRGRRPGQEPPPNLVWHALKFKNKEALPLTAGVISFFSEEEEGLSPIGQNELSFTPGRSNALARMLPVPDILVTTKSQESGRKNNARNYNDLITVEATVRAMNLKSEKIALRINQEVRGRLLDSDTDWKTSTSFLHAGTQNPISEATWEVSLKPGEERVIAFRYEVYEE